MSTSSSTMRVLFLDNFDSFSYSLVDEFRRKGASVEVWRNGASMAVLEERLRASQLLVLSPGPGRPEEAGAMVELLKRAAGKVPVFGVCLGYQALASAFGGIVERAPRLVHGKASAISHCSTGVFAGLPEPFVAGRYHSLAIGRMPEGFSELAWVEESGAHIPMAIEDSTRNLVGVQFHPESILTRDGSRLIANVMKWAEQGAR